MNILENLKKLNLDFFKKNFLFFIALLFLFLDAVSALNYFKFFIHFPSEIFRSYQHSIIFFKGVIILSLIIAFCVFILRKYFKTYKTYCFLFLAILFLIIFSILDFALPIVFLASIIFLPFIVIKYFKIGLAIYFSFLIGCIISTIGAEGFGVAVGGLFALIMVFPYSIILGISQFLFVRKKNKSLSKWNIVGFAFVYFMGCFVTMAATDAIDHLF